MKFITSQDQEAREELIQYADSVIEDSLKARDESNFCKVFGYALPILQMISNFWFLPKKVRYIVNDLIAAGSAICANTAISPLADKTE